MSIVKATGHRVSYVLLPMDKKPTDEELSKYIDESLPRSFEFENREAANEVASFLLKTGCAAYCFMQILIWGVDENGLPKVLCDYPVSEFELVEDDECSIPNPDDDI